MALKIAVIGARGLPATYGGIEKHCEELFSGLARKGHEITVYSRNYYTNYNEYNGIKIKKINVPNIVGFETLIYSFIAVLYATFSDVNIIHFHAQGPTLFSFIPKLLAPQKKLVFTCHGIDWQRDKWNFIAKTIIKLGEKASATFPHVRIGVSQSLIDYYRDKYNVPVQKVYNGINIQSKLSLNKLKGKFNLEENEYFLFVGRLVPEKAPDILIKAFKNLQTAKKLVIVGDSAGTNDYVAYLKDLAKDDKRIIFTSYLYGEDLIEIFSNSLAYLSASRLEGLPITVLEAMSFSKPLILSDICPHLEPIAYDKNCAITFKTDNIQDCTGKIQYFLAKSQKEIEKMGKISHKIVSQHFIWDNIINKVEELYFS